MNNNEVVFPHLSCTFGTPVPIGLLLLTAATNVETGHCCDEEELLCGLLPCGNGLHRVGWTLVAAAVTI